HDDQARRQQRFTRHPPLGVLAEDGVEDGVGDLVRHLVRVTLGHRLRTERPPAHRLVLPLRRSTTASSTSLATARLSINVPSSSKPSAPTTRTRLVSCSKPAPGAATLLATTRSTPLDRSFVWAEARTSP